MYIIIIHLSEFNNFQYNQMYHKCIYDKKGHLFVRPHRIDTWVPISHPNWQNPAILNVFNETSNRIKKWALVQHFQIKYNHNFSASLQIFMKC